MPFGSFGVAVYGTWPASPAKQLADTVFQGTVLWNLFYEDARRAATSWASQNRFGPSKEFRRLIHRRFHNVDNFKLLGIVFDPALLMRITARTIATEARLRFQT